MAKEQKICQNAKKNVKFIQNSSISDNFWAKLEIVVTEKNFCKSWGVCDQWQMAADERCVGSSRRKMWWRDSETLQRFTLNVKTF
jgi:hypothetical protein